MKLPKYVRHIVMGHIVTTMPEFNFPVIIAFPKQTRKHIILIANDFANKNSNEDIHGSLIIVEKKKNYIEHFTNHERT